MLTAEQIPQQAAAFVTSLSSNPLVVLMLLNIFLLIVGLPLEANPAIIILVPILGPIIQSIGVDPVHFSIIVILNLMLGSVHAARGHPGFRHLNHRPRVTRQGVSRVRAVPRGRDCRSSDRHLRTGAESVSPRPFDGGFGEMSFGAGGHDVRRAT